MKIFFTASYKGKEKFDKYYQLINKTLDELGYPNIDNKLATMVPEVYYESLRKEGKVGYEKLFNDSVSKLKTADINIFECSYESFAIGYMIEKSLELNKPTIVLHLENYPLYFLEGIEDDKLGLYKYDESSNLKSIISNAIATALDLREKRFNFFVSPEILTYLDDASKEDGITKSSFIRNLINEHQKKNS